MSVNAKAQQLQEKYEGQAGLYDALVVHWRTRATWLELAAGILLVFLGVNGAGGFIQAVKAFHIGGDPTFGEVVGAIWSFIPSLLSMIAGLIAAYITAVQPRQKQVTFGNASAACMTVALAGKAVANMTLEDENDYRNAITSVLTGLENSVVDDLPPLGAPEPKKAK